MRPSFFGLQSGFDPVMSGADLDAILALEVS
jgi:hypothetical protein